FKVPQSAAEILESIYQKLNPTYPLALSDLTATAALSVGEVAVRASLFEGKGLLEVSVDKFTARFEGLRTEGDLKLVRDVIILSEEALQSVFPNMHYTVATIKSSAWLNCKGEEKGVKDLLEKYGTPKLGLSPSKFGATKITNFIRSELINEEMGWSTNILIERSIIPATHLYILCGGTYLENDNFKGFREQVGHYENIYRMLLAHYELEPVTEE
ncbi:MAG: hypothetical protein MN733_21345, partial [Nitrososphaera sp.]|nr:hypothetical protein [Nitrososphaera sp.]